MTPTAVPPTPMPQSSPTPQSRGDAEFIVVATDAPNPPFTAFNEFGEVVGFTAVALTEIAANAGFEFELVVTPSEGVLETIAAGSNRDFDAVLTNQTIPQQPAAGIAYTNPYLEIGQVLVVLVDNRTIDSYQQLESGMRVGVAQDSWSGVTAEALIMPLGAEIVPYSNSVAALQALIDEEVTAVLTDHTAADYFTNQFPDQIKTVGGEGEAAWIDRRSYGIAIAADDPAFLQRLNNAIAAANNADLLQDNALALLPNETLTPGEPRAGASTDEFVIGMVGNISSLDPAAAPDLIDWEIKSNIMSGLYRISPTGEIEPMLAAGAPTVSEDGLEYTVPLREGLLFSDSTEMTATDVKFAVDRARSLGSFLVNDYLKDSDDNNFADDDAVQVTGQYEVKFVLQEPLGYFPSIMATPPYFPVSDECFNLALEPTSTCGGIGPYSIADWQVGEQIVLQANEQWPGQPAPAFGTIVVRFFADVPTVQRALQQFQSVDLLWTGVPYADLQASFVSSEAEGVDVELWRGTAVFKSYLMFNHEAEPWDRERIRLAAAYALDRDALATLFDGSREPLLSPIPTTIPGHVSAFPERNLDQARTFLRQEGFSETNPLAIELWYVNDGRYSAIEDAYVNEIKQQLEETNVFQVTVSGADFQTFAGQIGSCGYPAYLLGWPSPGRPSNYLDVTSWTDFFIQTTDSGFCSNYDSEQILQLVEAADAETNGAARLDAYGPIQELWSQDLPTLPLLQEDRFAVSLGTIQNVQIDPLGLLHYELLTKESE